GIVTKIVVKLTPLPETVKTILAIFETVEDASSACSGIIAAGVVPSAMEMMDRLALQAVEEAVHAGYPKDAGAVLLIEVDGLDEAMDDLVTSVERVCQE